MLSSEWTKSGEPFPPLQADWDTLLRDGVHEAVEVLSGDDGGGTGSVQYGVLAGVAPHQVEGHPRLLRRLHQREQG